jgi:hypothetical protein
MGVTCLESNVWRQDELRQYDTETAPGALLGKGRLIAHCTKAVIITIQWC